MMNIKKFWILIMIVSIPFNFLSCASTPQKRIEKKESVFVKYPVGVQGMIQNGQIDKGFDQDMVYMAKGVPDEKETIKKGNKIVEIWKYSVSKPEMVEVRGQPSSGFGGSYSATTPGSPPHPTPMFYSTPNFFVEFEDGKVSTWKEK